MIRGRTGGDRAGTRRGPDHARANGPMTCRASRNLHARVMSAKPRLATLGAMTEAASREDRPVHKVLRALFRDHWPKLTDSDLDRVNGQVARLTTLLGEKYGYPRRRAERELLHFLDDSMRKVEQGALQTTCSDGSGTEMTRISVPGEKRGETVRNAGKGKERAQERPSRCSASSMTHRSSWRRCRGQARRAADRREGGGSS